MKTLLYFRKLFVAIWVGKIIFFGAVIAPNVFRLLSRQAAAELQNSIFPTYFSIGIACALFTMIISSIFALKTKKVIFQKRIIGLSLIAASIYGYLMFILMPELNSLQPQVMEFAKDAQVPIVQDFNALHKLSTSLNFVVLVIGLFLLALV